MRRSRLAAVLAVTALAGTFATPSASASSGTEPPGRTLARDLVAPLSLAVHGDDVLVTQNFAGKLSRLRPGKTPKTLYASQGGNEVGGVSIRGESVVFTETEGDEHGPTDSWLKRLGRDGKAHTIAHIRAYEEAANPDQVITYGVRGIPDDCAAQWPTDQFGPPVYTGAVDSHPYATYQTRRRIYVADAGMNAVLAVSRTGKVRTVAVTPAVPVVLSDQLVSGMGLPACATGLTYYGESVPTDVQRGADGRLYVTTEGGGLGEQMPLGSIYRINPATGAMHRVVDGLMAPTGLAVSPTGDIYVAQLFGGEISRIRRGSDQVRPFVHTGLPAAVELSGDAVYATTNVLPPESGAPDGRVVRYRR